MLIRRATASDLEDLCTFYHVVSDAMIGTPFDCCWRRDIHPSDSLIARLIEDDTMIVAIDEGRVIGAVGIDHDLGHDYGPLPWLVDVPDCEVGIIHLLAADQTHRKGGVARKLLDACKQEAARQGLRTLRLDVTENNAPARALYESEGYAYVGWGLQEIGPDDHPFVRLEVMELVL